MFFQMGWFNHQLYSLPSLKAWEQKTQKNNTHTFFWHSRGSLRLGLQPLLDSLNPVGGVSVTCLDRPIIDLTIKTGLEMWWQPTPPEDSHGNLRNYLPNKPNHFQVLCRESSGGCNFWILMIFFWQNLNQEKSKDSWYSWWFRSPAIATWDGAKNPANHRRNYQPQLVSRISEPSTPGTRLRICFCVFQWNQLHFNSPNQFGR